MDMVWHDRGCNQVVAFAIEMMQGIFNDLPQGGIL